MINYLILIHKSPSQFRRLVEALDAPWVSFFIHVDKKCNVDEFKKFIPEKDNVHYVTDENRIDGKWGDLSLVDATLACMRLALYHGASGHSILLSGQDYPLRNPKYIRDYLLNHQGNNFLSVYPIPDPKKASENGGMERLISYTFDCCNPKNPRLKAKIQPLSFRLKTLLGFLRLIRYRRGLLPLACKLYFKKRDYPQFLSKHFNEFWCVLNVEAVKKIVALFDENSIVREYYKYTHIPDETAFSSILCADREIKKNIMPMCHYIDWGVSNGGSPKTLGIEDLPQIRKELASKPYVMFARKFEENACVLDVIDKTILQGA